MSKPVVLSTYSGRVAIYKSADDIPAEDALKCRQGMFYGCCTRHAGHEGDHGQPNWEGHAEVEGKTYGGVQVDLRNSHQSSPMNFTSYKQWREFIDLVDAEVMDMFEKKDAAK